MSGYKELIEIDVNSDNVEVVEKDRTVDESGRISVGRDKSGRSFGKIILIQDAEEAVED